MPIYKVNGEIYDIPANKQEAFEKKYPDASVSYISGNDAYDIPIGKRESFLTKFPDAQLETNYQSSEVPIFNDAPNSQLNAYKQPESEEETIRGFGAAAKQSAKSLGAGVRNAWGEFTNMFTGSSRDDVKALSEFDRMIAEGKDVAEETENTWSGIGGDLRTAALEILPNFLVKGWKERGHDKAEEQKILRNIHDALKETNGDVDKARSLLVERAKDMSYGDTQMAMAAETMSEMKPTEGFGAWLGENAVQMIPSASALIVGAVTKSPTAARIIGQLGMGGMTAATAGQSMYEARQSGANDYETRKVGIVDGMIEYLTEKIPFDRYTKRLTGKVRKETAEALSDALSSPNSPAKEEMQNVLTKANEVLGGKLFSKKSATDYLLDMAAEGASEFSAEALQTITSIIYEEPENYPTITEVLSNGWQGFLAGAFMGAVLGGSSAALANHQHKERRRQQGFVKIALVDNGENGQDVGEVVAYDPEADRFTITDGNNSYEVEREAIKQTFDYTVGEFESGIYRQLEDDAIAGGNVSNGQVVASADRLGNARQKLEDAMSQAGYTDEQKNTVFADLDKGDVPDFPPQAKALWNAADSYTDALNRDREIQSAREARADSERKSVLDAMQQQMGGEFWQKGSTTMQENGMEIVEPDMVEVGTMQNGKQVYILSTPNDNGEVPAITEDGKKMFIRHTDLQDGTQLMPLQEFLDAKVSEQKQQAEQLRMAQEAAPQLDAIRQKYQMGVQVNLGTEESPTLGQVIGIKPENDGVIIQTETGIAPYTFEQLADMEGTPIRVMTDAQQAAAEAAEIQAAEATRMTELAQTPEQISEAEKETDNAAQMENVATETPLPTNPDGSVNEDALFRESPERWAVWNDEQSQDGGVSSAQYIETKLAKAQARLAELQNMYSVEDSLNKKRTIQAEIVKQQGVVDDLAAVMQKYTPAEAVQSTPVVAQQERTTESVLASLNDGTLTEEEIRENIDANLAEAQKSYDKYAKKAPKMGTDKDAYLAEKQKYEQGLPILQQEIDFWNGVKQAYEGAMQQESLPTEESMRPELTEEDMNPQTPQELAARELGLKEGGIKLLWDSVRAHTGFGNGERQKFFGIFRSKEKGGMTIEAAGDRLMEIDREYTLGLLDQSDPMAGVNAILDVLGDVQTTGDLRNYIANNREAQVAREASAAYSAMNAEFEATHGMTMEEWAHANEVQRIEIMSKSALTEAEEYERNVKFAEEENQYGTNEQSTGTEGVSGGENQGDAGNVEGADDSLYRQGDSILQEAQSDNTGGETVSAGQTTEDVSEGDNQDGDTSVHAGEQTSEVSRIFAPSAEVIAKIVAERREAVHERINTWINKLGIKINIIDSYRDVENEDAKAQIEKGGEVWGWFETSTGEVCIYLPDFMSLSTSAALSEIDKTCIHEIVSHKGLRGLLGEDAYGELCDMVWEAMTEEEQQSWMQYPGVNGNTRMAADEYIAHFAESVEYNQTIWDKIVKFIKELFASKDVAINISDEGLTELLRASYDKLVSEASARMEPEKISLNDYLGRLGLSSPISDYMDDKLRNPHGLSKSQRNQLEKEAKDAADDYHARRDAAVGEYNRMVAQGKIIPPTQIDRLIATANGHPDNEATQAARRSLEKRGYDWQTGQKKPAEVQSEVKKASKTIKAERAKDEKIEDFGEKIGGARKDVARAKIRDSVKLTTKDLVELKDPDKILSRKNIIKYYSEGVMTFEDAVKLLAMNMAVRGRDTIDRGVAMKKYRNLAMAWEGGSELIVEITDEDVQDRMNEYSERMRQTPDFEKKTRKNLEMFVLKVYNDYKATYEALNYPEVYRNLKSAYIRYGEHDGKYWVVGGPNAYRGYPFPTLEQAIAKMVKLYPEQTVAKKPSESKKDGEKSSSIHVTKDRAGYYRIKSRNIPGEIYLSGKMYSKKDAEAYLAENLDKLEERENRLLEALLGSNIGMVEREGLDYRKGKDVPPKDFLDTFGFRGVEFGNWVPQVERQAYLNKTYDAIMDFCRIVGISPKAFSLGGRLGLAFGSRGKSRALAHYEPMKEVINLTRMKGAGSLAHEWFHALDNYLAKQRSGNTSDMTTDNKPAVRQEVTDAFNAFVSAMNRLAYTRRSNRAGQYWGEVWERAARLFESYIYNELGGQNIVSPLLVKKDTLYVDHGEFSDDAWPYPSAEENEQMKPYFDRLFSTLQEQVEEDGSVTLFRAKDAGRKQAQFDIINETNPMTDDYHVGIRKVEDIKTFDEVMETARRESEEGGWPELASYPDIENSLLEEALETRRIVIYSSHPISNGTFVTPSYIQADEYSGMTGEVYSKEVSVDDIAWINTDEGQYASLNDATDRYKDTPDEDIRFRTEQTKDRVENLFTAAVNGTFKGKPVSIGTLTKEGKQYLESISGLTFKDKVDFMLNASDLVHMYNEHFGENEKDLGSNIPLTIDDIRNIVDVVLNPEKVLYLGEDEGKRFAFLAPADSGAYNLIEVYTTKRGNLSSKTFYKTKKGVSHRAMILEKESRHSTSETNGATLSDAKIPILFDIANQGNENTLFRTRITPEQDAAYLKAVEAGDMETAQRMVLEAAKLAMPNTKVVDKNGNPKVVYHGTPNEFWSFDKDKIGSTNDSGFWGEGFYFTSQEALALHYAKGGRVLPVFLNIRNPHDFAFFTKEYYDHLERFGMFGDKDFSSSRITEELTKEGKDGVIRRDSYDGHAEYVVFSPSQIKSADPVTYDDKGNVIPLSDRFNEEKDDIRFRTRYDVNTNPTEAQKKAGNYKMGHIRLDGYNITIENPKGTVRRGTDSKGNAWENTLSNDYGYIRGTEGVDGDHIDVYLSDNPTEGNVFVIDQVNPETREFDEHKVMYGFNSAEEAREAYLANFSEGWNGLGTITEVSKDEFKKWIESSHRKTKPFGEYKSVRANEMQATDESDLRYRVVTNQETLDRLNSEPTIKVYRAMQVIDGKLYPPMSAKVDGKLREPIELGQWEEAEERPDLADEKGYFKLDKGNKTSVPARYNPYFHTSRTPLNDQFSSAQTRPNLVTVEVEVPESELTSDYKAEKAKDSVGEKEWKAGIIQGKLSGTRKVILSRWDKPVRILPDNEVAERIVEMFDGRDITMPSNVVTPSLRTELEKLGIPFIETNNQGKPIGSTQFRTTGTPTEQIVNNGLPLSVEEFTNLAADIYKNMPEDIRRDVVEYASRNRYDLKNAVFQISASLAEKAELTDEEIELAKMVAQKVEDAVLASGMEMTRPFTTNEALWMLYQSTNPTSEYNLIGNARKAVVTDNLGFSKSQQDEQEKDADNILFRSARGAAANSAAAMYNNEQRSAWGMLRETYQDMYRSVKSLIQAIEKATGKDAQSWENILTSLNALSSKNLADKKKYLRDFLTPMWDAAIKISDNYHKSIEEIERYLMIKHGLERNKVLAARDARNFYREQAEKEIAAIKADKSLSKAEQKRKIQDVENIFNNHVSNINAGIDAKFQEFRAKDYGGLTALFSDFADYGTREDYESEELYQEAALAARTPKYATLAETEIEAQKEVDAFEKEVDKTLIDNLWKKINAATKETLRHQYANNMLTKEQYERVRDMFEFYVPLRGFVDTTAEDTYSYYVSGQQSKFANPLQGAKGRKTQAETPLGWIGSMAESAIQMDNKNTAKLALYYFAVNRPNNDILKITPTWYEWTGEVDSDGKKIFEPVYPTFNGPQSGPAMQAQMDAFESMMEQQAQAGNAYKGKQRIDLKEAVIRAPKSTPEHVVTVKVAGEDYSIIINANPRAAQAINGMLNIDKGENPLYRAARAILRFQASIKTSLAPLFWITNFMRDVSFAFINTSIRNDVGYTKEFAKNYPHAFRVFSYVHKNRKSALGNTKYEKYYTEFAENGGITGYTSLTNNTEYDQMMKTYAKNARAGKFIKGIKGALEVYQDLGESFEQVSRFAAYITARESGKDISESIYEAKEVTINFNRKGSGKAITWEESGKMRRKSGKPLTDAERIFFVTLGGLSPVARSLFMFFNAGMQGVRMIAKLAHEHPGKSAAWAGIVFTMGLINAIMHAMMEDDDEYLDMPDYVRRSNVLIGRNGYYFKWSLPHEVRPFYAMADIFVQHAMGRKPNENIAAELAETFGEWMPINPFKDGLNAFMPDIIRPFVEIKNNKDFTGSPIYREYRWLTEEQQKNMPAYEKGFDSTSKILVDVSEMLNDLSGGDQTKAGFININPAVVEHLAQEYGGGPLKLAEQFFKTIGVMTGDQEFSIRNTPFLSTFMVAADDRYRNAHTTELFKYYKGMAEDVKRRAGEYKAEKDKVGFDRLRASDDFQIFQIYRKYEKRDKFYNEQLKRAKSDSERKEIMSLQDAHRKRMIEEISKL